MPIDFNIAHLTLTTSKKRGSDNAKTPKLYERALSGSENVEQHPRRVARTGSICHPPGAPQGIPCKWRVHKIDPQVIWS